MSRIRLSALTSALLALLLLAQPAEAQLRPRARGGLGPDRGQEVLDLLGPEHVVRDAWRMVERHFFDKSLLREKGWDQSLERALTKARGLSDPLEVHRVINEMLGELKVSHLALLENDVWRRLVGGRAGLGVLGHFLGWHWAAVGASVAMRRRACGRGKCAPRYAASRCPGERCSRGAALLLSLRSSRNRPTPHVLRGSFVSVGPLRLRWAGGEWCWSFCFLYAARVLPMLSCKGRPPLAD